MGEGVLTPEPTLAYAPGTVLFTIDVLLYYLRCRLKHIAYFRPSCGISSAYCIFKQTERR